MEYTRELLEKAMYTEDEFLAQSLLKEVRVEVGVDYLITELQRYVIEHSSRGELSDYASDLVLDLLKPLLEDSRTLDDANYVAPNLSPEVGALMVLLPELATKALASNSPNWYMVPSDLWLKFLQTSKAALDRHAA